jgi:hypothetical protein
VERILAPSLRSGQVVVMDNLSAHKGERVRELIEGRGCELLYLPSYSPDFNPIAEAFSKRRVFFEKARPELGSRSWRPSERRSRRSPQRMLVASSSTADIVCMIDYCDKTAEIWSGLLYDGIVLDCR